MGQAAEGGIVGITLLEIGSQQVGGDQTQEFLNGLAGGAAGAGEHRPQWLRHALVSHLQVLRQMLAQPAQKPPQVLVGLLGVDLAVRSRFVGHGAGAGVLAQKVRKGLA